MRKVAADFGTSSRRFCAVSRQTTSPPRSAALHYADASKATPSSWSGFRPRMHAPAAFRLSSLRRKQAETHHGEVASTRDQLQEHHDRHPFYAHKGHGDARGHNDGQHAHGRVMELRQCGTLPTPTGFRCGTYAKPAAWFKANSGLQMAPPPHPTQFKRTAGFHERVRALMEVADLNQKLNQTVKDSF